MAVLNFCYGGNFDTDPIRRYVGGSSNTFSFEEEEFTVDNFKSKIHELGFSRYKLRYVASIEDLPNQLYQVDKIRDFNNLREIALSTGNIIIFIEDKSKRSKLKKTDRRRNHPSSSTNHEQDQIKQNTGVRRKKLVTIGPKRRIVSEDTQNSSISNEEEDQGNDVGENAASDATNIPSPNINKSNAKDIKDVGEDSTSKATNVPLSVVNKCPAVNCDVARYAKLIDKLSRDQRQWVKDMGFRHMLKIKINHIDPLFGVWVTSRFDAQNKTLTIRENMSISIDDEMVGWVLGIPAGPNLFYPEDLDAKEFKEWKMKYKQDTMYGAILESVVYNMVLSEKRNKTRFQRHFLLYTLGILLCPTQKRDWISPLHIYMLGNASKAYKYNWGKYVLDWLVKYREKYDKGKEGRGGCTLLLLIIYLDRIAPGRTIEWNTTSCRVRYWDQSDVNSALETDKGNNGGYGFAQAVENVVYGKAYPTE